jgi:hypothetical protein
MDNQGLVLSVRSRMKKPRNRTNKILIGNGKSKTGKVLKMRKYIAM